MGSLQRSLVEECSISNGAVRYLGSLVVGHDYWTYFSSIRLEILTHFIIFQHFDWSVKERKDSKQSHTAWGNQQSWKEYCVPLSDTTFVGIQNFANRQMTRCTFGITELYNVNVATVTVSDNQEIVLVPYEQISDHNL